jgi:Asp-tRNA(Asn)/Glu-tRNA(Gln) amidotransferase A subunit family amidase
MADRRANELSATKALARMCAGELTSEALVAACLARIGADRRRRATLDRRRAQRRARHRPRAACSTDSSASGHHRHRRHATALGSSIYATRRPAWDAACVAAIRAAGGIILGKTVTTEFAYFTPGKTRNPRLEHTPGRRAQRRGRRMVPLALAANRGSVSVLRRARLRFRIHRASRVRRSRAGRFARGVADLALLRSVLTGRRGAGDASPLPARLVPRRSGRRPGVRRDTLLASVERLGRARRVREITLPPRFAALGRRGSRSTYEAGNYRFEMGHRERERLRG